MLVDIGRVAAGGHDLARAFPARAFPARAFGLVSAHYPQSTVEFPRYRVRHSGQVPRAATITV